MLSIPLSIVMDVHTTGSTVVDWLGQLSIWLYDLVGNTGSAIEV